MTAVWRARSPVSELSVVCATNSPGTPAMCPEPASIVAKRAARPVAPDGATGTGSELVSQARDAVRGRRVRHEQVAELDLAARERVHDVGGRLGRRHVHRDLLGVRIDLLQGPSEGLAGAEQLGPRVVGLVL